MKKYFNYGVMMVIMMTLCVGFSSCKDDEKGNDTEENGNGGNGGNNGNGNNNATIDLQPSGNLKITESTGKEFVVGYYATVKNHYDYNVDSEYNIEGAANNVYFRPYCDDIDILNCAGVFTISLKREGIYEDEGEILYISTGNICIIELYCETKLEKGEVLKINDRYMSSPVCYFDGEGSRSDLYYTENYQSGTIEIIDINKATFGWRNNSVGGSFSWQNPGNITVKFSNVQFKSNNNNTLTIHGTIKLPYCISNY